MAAKSTDTTALAQEQEQETLWYFGGQRIITALGARVAGACRLIELLTPAGTFLSAHRLKEDEALYVLAGEAMVLCGEQIMPVSAGTFLFLPCNVSHCLEISAAGPLRYLTWMMPAGFAQDVTRMGNPDEALCLAPPTLPDAAKVRRLADLLRETLAQ